MPYPANVSTVTVTGSWANSDGLANTPTGTVTFVPNVRLVDAGTGTIIERVPIVATLSGGSISVTLMATDDPDLSPAGWAYQVTEKIAGQAPATYFLKFPAAQSPVDLASKTPLAAVSNLAGYVATSAVGAANGVASLDDTGNVPSSQLGNATGGGGGVPTSRRVDTTAPLSGGGDLSANRTLAVADASSGAKGVVQLAGDLGGTAASPTVPGLAGKANVSHAHAESDVTNLASDLSALAAGVASKVPTSRQVTAGTGLTGGGDLTSDRSFSVAYGTTSGTAAQGNDSRITGAAQKASNLSDLASASTARTNLGLGGAAVLNVGTTAGTVAAGDDSRFSAGGGGMDQIWPLSGMGLISAAGDPFTFMGTGGYGNNNMFATRIWVPAGKPITNLHIAVRDAGVWDGSTTGNGLALFSDAGVFIDQFLSNSLWTSNGLRGGAIGTPVAGGAGRYVYILPLARGMTTPANVALPSNSTDNHLPWFSKGLGTHHRCIIIGGTSFPGSFDPTAGSATTFMPWVAIS